MERSKQTNSLAIFGGRVAIVGLILFVIQSFLPEYVDAQGILHENFFLLPLGYLCLFTGVIALGIYVFK